MRKDNIKDLVSGVLVIDKPVGVTSHGVVEIVRRGTGIRRAGHTGTLDPRASGVLVVLIGPAVRLSEYVASDDKRYQATIRLGTTTDTYDSEGRITSTHSFEGITEEQVREVLEGFKGEIEQVPPPYSAIRVKGRRAYDMARKGEPVELKPRKIQVYELELLEWAPPDLVVDVYCSSGTYVRSLAHDLGEALGCGAYLVGLRRTRSGHFTLRQAVSLRRLQEAFQQGNWYQYLIPAAEAVPQFPILTLNAEEMDEVYHGHRIPAEPNSPEMVRALSEQGDLVALLQFVPETNEWQPKKVFLTS